MGKEDLFEAYRSRRDPAALRALLDSYQGMVYNLTFQVLRHPQNAEDASQLVFLKLLDHLGKIADSEHLRRWVCQVSFHTALDLKRGEGRRMAHEKQGAGSEEPPRSPGSDSALEILHEHMARLDDRARCLLADHYYGGQPLAELAARMGCSTVAVWKKIEKAKGSLRKSMTLAGVGGIATGLETTLGAIVSVPAPPGLLSPAILAKVGTAASLGHGAATVMTGGIALKLNTLAIASVIALAATILTLGVLRHRDAREIVAPVSSRLGRSAVPSAPPFGGSALPEPVPARSPVSRADSAGRPPAAPARKPKLRESLGRILAAIGTRDPEKIRSTLDALRGEFAQAPVPDAQNAALLYRKAFERFNWNEEDWDRWMARSDDPLLPQDRVALKELVAKNQEALSLIHEAAALPKCNYGLDYSKGANLEIPHVNKMIEALKVLETESQVADDADLPGVAKAATRLAESVANEPVLLSQFVRAACQLMAANARERALNTPIGEADLQDMLSGLEPQKLREGLESTLLFEFYSATNALLSGEKLNFLLQAGAPIRPPTDPLRDADLAHMAETYSQFSDLLGKPYYEIRDQVRLLQKTQLENAPWYADLTRMMAPAFEKACEQVAETEASLGAAKVGAALKLYQARNGQYPASLSDLASILPEPLVDPFSGQPFLYRREGSGFVVYSVGKAGQDYGGIADPLRPDRVVVRVRQ